MKTDIRKISVGKGYPDGAMHYQVGKIMRLQNIPYLIHSIIQSEDETYDIYLSNEEGKVLWKTIKNMPVLVENNINFD